MIACENGHLDVAKRLNEFLASIDVCAEDGTTCLIVAAASGKVSICEWLIDEVKVDLNQTMN
jgi:ankyrin repeat protein